MERPVMDIERELDTRELLRLAVDQARHLARAEVLHAKLELKEELKRARIGVAFLGAAVSFLTAFLAVGFMAWALALPLALWADALIAAGVLGALGLAFAAIGVMRLPKEPMKRTRERLQEDVSRLREELE